MNVNLDVDRNISEIEAADAVVGTSSLQIGQFREAIKDDVVAEQSIL